MLKEMNQAKINKVVSRIFKPRHQGQSFVVLLKCVCAFHLTVIRFLIKTI